MKPEATSVDEIYVDTRDASTLREILKTVASKLIVGDDDADAGLGLTRLPLSNAAAAMEDLYGAPPAPAFTTDVLLGGDDDLVVPTDIDRLLEAVRAHAREHYGRWSPTFDRNHDVGHVITNPHVKISDVVPPKPADAPPPLSPQLPTGPRIGIADTQVWAHRDLSGHFLAESLRESDPFPYEAPGHATFVASTVLRRAPSAVLVCETVLVHDEPNTSWTVAKRLMKFRGIGIDILNMSFGCKVDTGPPLPLQRALALLGSDILLIAAAGNQGSSKDPRAAMYPAAFGEVTAVGAAYDFGLIAEDTPKVPWLDLLAPGENVVGAFLQGDVQLDGAPSQSFKSGYASWSGSSFAAAAVTGKIASMMHDRGIDAFTAKDELLAQTEGDIKRYQHMPTVPAYG